MNGSTKPRTMKFRKVAPGRYLSPEGLLLDNSRGAGWKAFGPPRNDGTRHMIAWGQVTLQAARRHAEEWYFFNS